MAFPDPPAQRTPFLDSTGSVTRPWYLWFQQIAKELTDHEERIEVLEP